MTDKRCSYCGSTLHPFSHCPKNANASNRLYLRCTYCGSSKHNYAGCMKIRSHPAPGAIIIRD